MFGANALGTAYLGQGTSQGPVNLYAPTGGTAAPTFAKATGGASAPTFTLATSGRAIPQLQAPTKGSSLA